MDDGQPKVRQDVSLVWRLGGLCCVDILNAGPCLTHSTLILQLRPPTLVKFQQPAMNSSLYHFSSSFNILPQLIHIYQYWFPYGIT